MAEKRLKVIVAGLGRIGWEYHLPQIAARSDFELLAVSDPMPDRCQEAVDKYNVPHTYADFLEMIVNEKAADLLIIASPTCFHAEQAITAMEHGVDVFCEKPLAGTLEEAERVMAAVRRSGRRLMLYQPHRLTPETVALREILRQGLLGDVFMTRRVCRLFSRRNDWQSKLDLGGGMLNNYGAHFIDQYQYVFGWNNIRVSGCELLRVVTSGDADDVVRLMLVNGNNVIGDIDINMASPFPEYSWTVYGNRGMARWESDRRYWDVRYLDKHELPSLALQNSMAARDRSYASEGELPWHEQKFPLGAGDPGRYYDFVFAYFAEGQPPFVPLESTMELMRINAECRRIASLRGV